MANFATFKIPKVSNEPNVSSRIFKPGSLLMKYQKHYGKDSADRKGLQDAFQSLQGKIPIQIPLVVAGKEVRQN